MTTPTDCPGTGRKTQPGMGRWVCPVCHVTVNRKGEPRTVEVPKHRFQVRP